MRKSLLLLTVLLTGGWLFAQEQVVNGDFELWGTGNGAIHSTEPLNWHSFRTAQCNLPFPASLGCGTVTGSNQLAQATSYDGSTCARLYCVDIFGNAANGNLTTGRIRVGSTTATSSANYNYTISTNSAYDHNSPFVSQPDSVTFWYKVNLVTGGNTGRATFSIHNNSNYQDPGGTASNLVANAADDNLVSTTWTRKAMAFNYTGNGASASYVLATFTTNPVGGAGDAGDEVFVDNVLMIYNMTPSYSISDICQGESFNLTYTCNATIADSNKTFYAELSNASGSFASPTVIGSTTRNVGQAASGTISCTIPSVPAGSGYKIRVRHANEDLAEVAGTAFTINAPAVAGTATPTASNNCTTQNGQVAVSGSTGTGFELFNGSGVSQTSNTTGTFTGLNPGTYYVEVTDVNGCMATTSTVTVNAPTNPTAGTTTPTASTSCTSPNGAVNVSGSNGTTFELFDSGNNSQGSNGTGSFSSLSPGDYYVEITTNGCMTTTSTVTVNAPTAPAAGTATPTDVTNCTSPNGQVVVTGSGGTSFELFNSSNVSQTSNGTGTFTGLAAGGYYVVVTDAAGCTATTSTVTVGNSATAPAAPAAGTDATYCDGDAMADLTAAAGAGGTLQWYLGGSPASSGTSQTPSSAVGVHIYTVTETVLGCESSPSTVTVTVNANATAGTATPTAATSCTTPDGQVAVSGDNGTGYELFDSGNNSQGTNATGTFTGLAAGDYYVVVSNGCTPAQTATVTVDPATNPTVGTVTPSDNSNCSTPNGAVNVSGSNGTSFELFDSGNNSITSNASGSFTGLAEDDYYVVVTGANGCTSTSSNVTVGAPTGPTAGTTSSVDNSDCANANGVVNVTGSNGTSFELFDSGNNSQATNATGAFTGLSQGDYYVVISDANGCTTTTATVTVGNNTGYTVTLAPATTQNINTNTDGTQIDATESSTATSREWMYTTTSGSGYMSFTPSETGASYTPNFANAGTYYVVCESVIAGCTVMSSEVEIVVTSAVGIDENEMNLVHVYSFENQMFVNLSNVTLNNPMLKVYSTDGKIVLDTRLNNGTLNTFTMDVPMGVYYFNIITNDNATTGKVVLK
ncbi:MAG: T9SS type A sorting domain-containing protein [Crocinitomicaceae bacterium]